MEVLLVVVAIGAAYEIGKVRGAARAIRQLTCAIQAGLSPATRAMRAALTLPTENDR